MVYFWLRGRFLPVLPVPWDRGMTVGLAGYIVMSCHPGFECVLAGVVVWSRRWKVWVVTSTQLEIANPYFWWSLVYLLSASVVFDKSLAGVKGMPAGTTYMGTGSIFMILNTLSTIKMTTLYHGHRCYTCHHYSSEHRYIRNRYKATLPCQDDTCEASRRVVKTHKSTEFLSSVSRVRSGPSSAPIPLSGCAGLLIASSKHAPV